MIYSVPGSFLLILIFLSEGKLSDSWLTSLSVSVKNRFPPSGFFIAEVSCSCVYSAEPLIENDVILKIRKNERPSASAINAEATQTVTARFLAARFSI